MEQTYQRLLDVQDLASFAILHANLEIETFSDLERARKQGAWSFADPLGAILELFRFTNETLEAYLDGENTDMLDYDSFEKIHGLSTTYGFKPTTPASLYQFDMQSPNPARILTSFIGEWYAGGVHEWNPQYAPRIKLRAAITTYCRTHTVQDVIKMFSIIMKPPALLLPFNGWQLAECFRLAYTRSNE